MWFTPLSYRQQFTYETKCKDPPFYVSSPCIPSFRDSLFGKWHFQKLSKRKVICAVVPFFAHPHLRYGNVGAPKILSGLAILCKLGCIDALLSEFFRQETKQRPKKNDVHPFGNFAVDQTNQLTRTVNKVCKLETKKSIIENIS